MERLLKQSYTGFCSHRVQLSRPCAVVLMVLAQYSRVAVGIPAVATDVIRTKLILRNRHCDNQPPVDANRTGSQKRYSLESVTDNKEHSV